MEKEEQEMYRRYDYYTLRELCGVKLADEVYSYNNDASSSCPSSNTYITKDPIHVEPLESTEELNAKANQYLDELSQLFGEEYCEKLAQVANDLDYDLKYVFHIDGMRAFVDSGVDLTLLAEHRCLGSQDRLAIPYAIHDVLGNLLKEGISIQSVIELLSKYNYILKDLHLRDRDDTDRYEHNYNIIKRELELLSP